MSIKVKKKTIKRQINSTKKQNKLVRTILKSAVFVVKAMTAERRWQTIEVWGKKEALKVDVAQLGILTLS